MRFPPPAPRAEVGARRHPILLSCLGGLAGIVIGAAATATYAEYRQWPVTVPGYVIISAVAATAVIGTVAGSYPAVRAAQLSPTEALQAD